MDLADEIQIDREEKLETTGMKVGKIIGKVEEEEGREVLQELELSYSASTSKRHACACSVDA